MQLGQEALWAAGWARDQCFKEIFLGEASGGWIRAESLID